MIAEQPTLFEQGTIDAIRARNEGMRTAWENDLNAMYRDRFLAAIHYLATKKEPFCSDDVRALCGDPPRFVSPNIAGACFNAAARSGSIKAIGMGRSKRIVGHANRVLLWQGQ